MAALALPNPPLIAVDSNVLIDLVEGDETVTDCLSTIRRKFPNAPIIIPPTVIVELADIASDWDNESEKESALRALRRIRAQWGFHPMNCVPVGHAIVEETARKIRLAGLIPPEEVHDSFILAESALANVTLLLSSEVPICRGRNKLSPCLHPTSPSGTFMISPGDCDPPWAVRATIDRILGTNYLWYPVVGNHDEDTATNMAWLRQWATNGIRGLVHHGPPGAEETTFSFEYANSHFLVLNEYAENPKGDLSDATLNWMREDLSVNGLPLIWVVGHKPIQSFPDMDTGRTRHGDDAISPDPAKMEKFLALLREYNVRAYLCGHTHNASVKNIQGIWQADSGHSRGAGDSGAPSTFLKIRVSGERAWVEIYRADKNGMNYKPRAPIELK